MTDPCRSDLQTIRDEMLRCPYGIMITRFTVFQWADRLTALLAQLDGLPQQKEGDDPRVSGERRAAGPTGSTAAGPELSPTAWGAFSDEHDYSRTGKHLPEACRHCLRSRPVLSVRPLRDRLTDIINAAFNALRDNLRTLPEAYQNPKVCWRAEALQKAENRRIEALHVADSAVLNWALELPPAVHAVARSDGDSTDGPRAAERSTAPTPSQLDGQQTTAEEQEDAPRVDKSSSTNSPAVTTAGKD